MAFLARLSPGACACRLDWFGIVADLPGREGTLPLTPLWQLRGDVAEVSMVGGRVDEAISLKQTCGAASPGID